MKVLYGTRINEPDYLEDIITTDEGKIEAATEWARENGFDRFRVATFEDGELPNFPGALNV